MAKLRGLCLLALVTGSQGFKLVDYFFGERSESDGNTVDVIADFGEEFFWGLGTASTHVEDVRWCVCVSC